MQAQCEIKKLTIFQISIILKYLNAADKIKKLFILCKEWNRYIYSGFAWQYLFLPKHDSRWNTMKLNQRTLQRFHNFKGIKLIYITNHFTKFDKLLHHANQFQKLYLQQEFSEKKLQQIAKIQLCLKLENIPNNYSSLHIAAKYGNISAVEYIMKRCEFSQYFQSLERTKITALYLASYQGHIQIVKILLNHDFGIDNNGPSAIVAAVTKNRTEIVKLLLQNGVDPNTDCQGHQLIHIAAFYKYIEIAKTLLTHGANPLIANCFGATALKISKINRSIKLQEIFQNFITGNELNQNA